MVESSAIANAASYHVCVMCPIVLWLVGGASFGDVAVLPFAQTNHLTDGERMRKVRRYLAGCYEVLDAATIIRNQILDFSKGFSKPTC